MAKKPRLTRKEAKGGIQPFSYTPGSPPSTPGTQRSLGLEVTWGHLAVPLALYRNKCSLPRVSKPVSALPLVGIFQEGLLIPFLLLL